LETAGGDTRTVLGIHEAKLQFGQHEFNHLVLIANLTDDILMRLDLMRQHTFHLDLENSVIKTKRNEFSVNMVEQTTRKVTLQGNYLPRVMKARPCQEGKTESPCRRVVLKSEAVRRQKILDTHHRRDIDLRVPVEKAPEQIVEKNKFGRSRRQGRSYRIRKRKS